MTSRKDITSSRESCRLRKCICFAVEDGLKTEARAPSLFAAIEVGVLWLFDMCMDKRVCAFGLLKEC